MKPKNFLIAAMIIGATLGAADYSQTTTQDMVQMRGNVPAEDREAFRNEMQNRMQSMTPEERQQYGLGQGKGQGNGQGQGQGNGQGKGKGAGRSQ
jgi:hypothetical protein